MSEADRDETVVLEFPPRREFLLLARTVTTSLASTLALDYETCEDLQLAVDELCAAIIGDAESDEQVRLELTVVGDVLVVSGTLSVGPGAARPIDLDPIAAQILHAVTDRVEVVAQGSDRRFRFEKLVAQ